MTLKQPIVYYSSGTLGPICLSSENQYSCTVSNKKYYDCFEFSNNFFSIGSLSRNRYIFTDWFRIKINTFLIITRRVV
jgi:hypothetical protein